MKFKRQSGVVLVITLIMLSIITVMAVAFLALSRRERASVVHTQNSIDAELMASTALERGKAEILAYIIGQSNLLGPDILVSGSSRTNPFPLYLPPFFYYGDPRDGVDDDKDKDAIGNLWRDARPPVFVGTNREQRFYLDLNRNGRFETNGVLPVLDATGNTILDPSNGVPVVAHYTGDPEWFGVLSKPPFQDPAGTITNLHSRNNRFIGRYAYLILPVGRSLDLNFIHNDAGNRIPLATAQDGYRRAQGVGSWEINLAAFLTDWKPNKYTYSRDPAGVNSGLSFFDAKNLLAYRYNGTSALASASQTFSPNAFLPGPANFASDLIDAYTFGLPALGLPPVIETPADIDSPWSGSDSARHFFSVHDLFRGMNASNVNLTGFTNAVATDPLIASSDERYSYYRLLAQLGTDSVPEPDDRKININFKNIGGFSPTNYVSWTNALEFFTNAAHRMLVEEFRTNRDPVYAWIGTNGINAIPVVLNGSPKYTNINGVAESVFSTRVHRLLQLAANIYEATVATNTPAVFRPVFRQTSGNNGLNLFITGFVQVDNNYYTSVFNGSTRVRTMTETNIGPDDLVFGVPLVIGARKGIPNFNEFAVQNIADFTRKLALDRPAAGQKPNQTNQMFILGISNVFGMEAWNPYSNDYPRRLNLYFANEVEASVNLNGNQFRTNLFVARTNQVFTFAAGKFRIPGIYPSAILSNAVYRTVPVPTFDLVSSANIFTPVNGTDTNKFGLTVRNKVLYFLTEETGQIIDSFSASDLDADFDISREVSNSEGDNKQFWDQNIGIQRQIAASMGTLLTQGEWNSYGTMDDKNQAIQKFQSFMNATPLGAGQLDWTNNTMQAPFTVTRKIIQSSRWEANDPIVHYLSDDLREFRDGLLTNSVKVTTILNTMPISITNDTSMGAINRRYRPWGGNPLQDADTTDDTKFDIRVKDPGIAEPNSWDFPMQKFPNVGWLGRVHRGTPWQTVYLKSYPFSDAEPDRWMMPAGGPGLSMDTHPTNDWKLVDLFTTAIHPNATRGRLSVNQTNLAAWSAVLSGVGVTSLADRTPQGGTERTNLFVDPAAVAPQMLQIFEGISRVRESMTNKVFERVGDILAVPELTIASPYLNPPFTSPRVDPDRPYLLRDIDYERIPDQILSLLKLGDARFVVYAFGQSLKPEYVDPSTGLALNYQITGEVATRSVIRVDYETVTDYNDFKRYGGPDVNRPHVVIEQFNVLPPE